MSYRSRIWLSLACVTALALLHLPHPFEWDQTTFLYGAHALARGGALYREWWDVKQPAIYVFYVLAGWLFGFDEVGVHALEVLWWTAFAAVLAAGLHRRSAGDAWRAPLLVAGVYWAAVGPWHLTQVEGLVGFPLWLATAWGATAADGEAPGRAFAAGLAGAAVLLLKLALAPVLALVWLVESLHAWRLPAPPAPATRRRSTARWFARAALPLLLGLALPLAAVVVHEARLGLLERLRWTTFDVPRAMLDAVHGTRVGVLMDGITWFTLRWAPVIGLAGAGAAEAWRTRDRLGLALIAWTAGGAAVVLAQRTSWWQYHWLLLTPPLGVLASIGAGALVRDTPASTRGPARVALALMFAGLVAIVGDKAITLARHRLALGPAQRRAYQEQVSQLYARADMETAFLDSAGALPGSIFSIDDPAIYWRSHRTPAMAYRGVRFYGQMVRADWDSLARALEAAPPAYVFVDADNLTRVTRSVEAAPMRAMLDRDYRPARGDALGAWWARVR